MERFDNCPIDTPIYLISNSHNLYIGTISLSPFDHKTLIRGKCIEGDSDSFYQEGFSDWAYIKEK